MARHCLLIDGFDELDPVHKRTVVEWFRALITAYPTTRIVTTGCADQLNGLIGLGFTPLALIGWDAARNLRFMQQWAELWSRTVVVESPSSNRSSDR